MPTDTDLTQPLLTLLALAESAPTLPADALDALATLDETLVTDLQALSDLSAAEQDAELLDLLSLTVMDLFTDLYPHPPFRTARETLNQQQPHRVGLALEEVHKTLKDDSAYAGTTVVSDPLLPPLPPDPTWPALALRHLLAITRHALQQPLAFANDQALIRQLTSLLGSSPDQDADPNDDKSSTAS